MRGEKTLSLRDRWFHQVEVGLALVDNGSGVREDVIAALTTALWYAGYGPPDVIDLLAMVKNPKAFVEPAALQLDK